MSDITPTRRIRHDVRDGLIVMAFSFAASVLVAFLITVLLKAGA